MIFNKKRSVLLSSLLILFFIQSTHLFSMTQILTQTWVTYLAPALGHLAMALGAAFSKKCVDSAALESLQRLVHDIAQEEALAAQNQGAQSTAVNAVQAIAIAPGVAGVDISLPAVEPTQPAKELNVPGIGIRISLEHIEALALRLTNSVRPRIRVIPQEQGFLAQLAQQAHFANIFKPQSQWTTISVPGITRYQHTSGLYAQIESAAQKYTLGTKLYFDEVKSANRHFALIKSSPYYVEYIRYRLDNVLQLVLKLKSPLLIDRTRAFFELNALRESWWLQSKIDPLLRGINNLATFSNHELSSLDFEHYLYDIVTNFLKDIGNKQDVSDRVRALGVQQVGQESVTSSIYRFARNATQWFAHQDKVFANGENQKLLSLLDACDRYDMAQAQLAMQQLLDNPIAQQIYQEFCNSCHDALYTKDGIYRLYEHDPLLKTIGAEKFAQIANDAISRAKLNQELGLRHLVKENICKAWRIVDSVLPCVEQTIYKIVDKPEILSSPAALNKFLAQEALSIPVHEYDAWKKSFFCPNGLVADFINWPEATQFNMPAAIHNLENVALRHSFNNALSLIHTNHVQAPVAEQVICYIERALTTQDAQLAQSYKTIVKSLEHAIEKRYPLAKILPDFTKSFNSNVANACQNLLVKMTAHLLESHHAAVLARAAYSTINKFSDALHALKNLVHGTQEVTGEKIQDLIKSGPYQDQLKVELLNELNQALHAQAIAQECGAHLPALEELPKPVDFPWNDPERKPLKGGQIIVPRPPEMGGVLIGGFDDKKPLYGGDCNPIKLPEPEPCNWSKGYGRLPSFKDPKHVDTNNPQMPPPEKGIGEILGLDDSPLVGGTLGQEAPSDAKPDAAHEPTDKGKSITIPEHEETGLTIPEKVESPAHAPADIQTPSEKKSKIIDAVSAQEKAQWLADKEKFIKLLKRALDVLKNKWGKNSEEFLKMQEGVRKVIQELNKADCKYHNEILSKGSHKIIPKQMEKYLISQETIAKLQKEFEGLLVVLDDETIHEAVVELKHILRPEIYVDCIQELVGTGGLHHDFLNALIDSGLLDIHSIERFEDGTYKIEWSYEGSDSKDSTFFPSDWTPEQVVDAMKEALKNIEKVIIKVKDKDYDIYGKTKNGMEIYFNARAVLDQVNRKSYLKITTAYPHKKREN